jgi:hypothetical protein
MVGKRISAASRHAKAHTKAAPLGTPKKPIVRYPEKAAQNGNDHKQRGRVHPALPLCRGRFR